MMSDIFKCECVYIYINIYGHMCLQCAFTEINNDLNPLFLVGWFVGHTIDTQGLVVNEVVKGTSGARIKVRPPASKP